LATALTNLALARACSPRWLTCGGGRFAYGHAIARLGEADQHGKIDAGDHFDFARLHQRNRQVRRGAAEQVGQHDHAFTAVDAFDRIGDFAAAFFHVVVGSDTDPDDIGLAPDDMFHRMDEFVGERAVGDDNKTDHELFWLRRA
jgi:hypothetical protein